MRKLENLAFWIGIPTIRLTENSPSRWARWAGFIAAVPLFPLALVGLVLLVISVIDGLACGD